MTKMTVEQKRNLAALLFLLQCEYEDSAKWPTAFKMIDCAREIILQLIKDIAQETNEKEFPVEKDIIDLARVLMEDMENE